MPILRWAWKVRVWEWDGETDRPTSCARSKQGESPADHSPRSLALLYMPMPFVNLEMQFIGLITRRTPSQMYSYGLMCPLEICICRSVLLSTYIHTLAHSHILSFECRKDFQFKQTPQTKLFLLFPKQQQQQPSLPLINCEWEPAEGLESHFPIPQPPQTEPKQSWN